MSVTIQPLIQAEQIAAAATLYFTAQGTTRIDAMTLYNPVGNAAEVVTVHIVPAGGAAGAANQVSSHNCLGGETFNVYGAIGQTLNVGDMIYAAGSAGGLVNLYASGTVQS